MIDILTRKYVGVVFAGWTRGGRLGQVCVTSRTQKSRSECVAGAQGVQYLPAKFKCLAYAVGAVVRAGEVKVNGSIVREAFFQAYPIIAVRAP